MIYETRGDFRYHFKKCFPIVALYLFLILLSGLVFSPYLSAGDTMFKECKACGHLNYQFSNTCSMCGATGRFEDAYLLPDCEKRDAKKKKAKDGIPVCSVPQIPERAQKALYKRFVDPINKVLRNIIHAKERYADSKIEYSEDLDAAFDNLLRGREQLIKFYGLDDYRQSLNSNHN